MGARTATRSAAYRWHGPRRHPGLHDASGTMLAGAGCSTSPAARPMWSTRAAGPARSCCCTDSPTPPTAGGGWCRRLLHGHRVIAIDIPPFGRSAPARLRRRTTLIDFYGEFFPRSVRELEHRARDGRRALARRRDRAQRRARAAARGRAAGADRARRASATAPRGGGRRWPGRRINWAALLQASEPGRRPGDQAACAASWRSASCTTRARMDDVIDHFVDLHGGRSELSSCSRPAAR